MQIVVLVDDDIIKGICEGTYIPHHTGNTKSNTTSTTGEWSIPTYSIYQTLTKTHTNSSD